MIIPDNIGEFRVGRVVKGKNINDNSSLYSIGHIIGFKINNLNELVIEVKWASWSGRDPYQHTSLHLLNELDLL